jgi:hypothetical protein
VFLVSTGASASSVSSSFLLVYRSYNFFMTYFSVTLGGGGIQFRNTDAHLQEIQWPSHCVGCAKVPVAATVDNVSTLLAVAANAALQFVRTDVVFFSVWYNIVHP